MRRPFWQAAFFVALCHFAAASVYLWRFPPWRAPDEGAHFAYIVHLAQTRSLPVFEGMGRGVTYEAHQPPLYYLTALPFVASLLEDKAHHQTALYLLRFFSTLWGLAVVLGAMGLAWMLHADPTTRLPAALLAGLFAALLPMHLLVCASVGNDAAAGAMATATLLWLCLSLQRPSAEKRQTLTAALTAGVLCGASLLAKSSNLICLPLALFALCLMPLNPPVAPPSPTKKRSAVPQSPRPSPLVPRPFIVGWRGILLGICLAGFLLTAGWWLWRNTVLYGDPLAFRAFLEGFSTSPKPSYFLERLQLSLPTYLLMVAQVTLFTWLGIFGEPNEAVKGLGRLMQGAEPTASWAFLCALIGMGLLVGMALGIVTMGRESWRAMQEKTWAKAFAYALPILMTLLVFAEFVQFNRHFFQAQARYFYPAHAAMAVLFAEGVLRLAPSHRAWWAVGFIGLFLAILCGIVGWLWVPLSGR
ncbi:MAG: hypothetical protein KEFWMYNX_001028 [Candidatus Fervidibacter sp.]